MGFYEWTGRTIKYHRVQICEHLGFRECSVADAERTRWGAVPLIDMLKEAVLRTGCLAAASTAAGRGDLAPEVLAERLMLAIYAYGTNTGIRAVAGSAQHGHSEDDIRYVRRRYLTAELARTVAVEIANATFAVRAQQVWGAGSTAVASDSTHFGAFDQNIFTEWHSRYGGRGVLIYWHVERKSMAIRSQLISCSASEVAAMVEGAMRHGTAMEVEGTYVDSHGQSEIGFGVTRLLGFDLLPRIKARYLRNRDLQREINEGLNVVESWNRANSVIFFGKGGDIATNRRDEQELSVTGHRRYRPVRRRSCVST
ncbi:Tn3 family transposase [Frankia sp. EAN1pec]|uniref:Tn3 family transposase n=1 Tax=Parafrankia sp. (strain EAN1pec) TaxID=298653 RepID=UPI00031AFB86